MLDKSTTINLLNPRGRVITVPLYLKISLLAQGYKLIMNPKEEWYPQHDKRVNESNDLNVLENIEEGNILEVEKI